MDGRTVVFFRTPAPTNWRGVALNRVVAATGDVVDGKRLYLCEDAKMIFSLHARERGDESRSMAMPDDT